MAAEANREWPKARIRCYVDDIILLFSHTATARLYYSLAWPRSYNITVTIKLRKTRFFPARAEFVGVDVTKEGNSPAQSKYEALI
jgi:hypothetical protein